jgi:hypothetical protein
MHKRIYHLALMFMLTPTILATACTVGDGEFGQTASSADMAETSRGIDTGEFRVEEFLGAPSAPHMATGGTSSGGFQVDSDSSSNSPFDEGGTRKQSPITLAVTPYTLAIKDDSGDLGVDAQERLIVRNVAMTIVVPEVSSALDDVAAAAVERGGWIVSTFRTADHTALISFRIPAEQLDETVRYLRDLATDVESETSTSRDVTEEFVDISARITNLEATEVQLRALLEREGDIEQILAVQQELTAVRGEIERFTGRKRLLEETAAFSLVTVTLEAEPSEITVDAGTDRVLVEGEIVRFRTEFTAPEGIEEFTYEWDFGDGTPVMRGFSTAPTDEDGTRTTATVVHTYRDEQDSPFFAAFSITGTGDAGISEGEDTVQVIVTSVPNIQISAGNDLAVTVGERVTFTGSFTRPEGVTNLKFRWDFGDGLAPLESEAADGATTIEAEHEYSIDRFDAYIATLSVTGETEHGAEVRADDVVRVRVTPASVWSETVVDLGETARAATRALSAAGQGAVGVGIWVIIFSPGWIGLIALGVFVNRRRPRRGPNPPTNPPDGEN